MHYKINTTVIDDSVFTPENPHWEWIVLNRIKRRVGEEIASMIRLYAVKQIRETAVCGDFVFMSLADFESIRVKLDDIRMPENSEKVDDIIKSILEEKKHDWSKTE